MEKQRERESLFGFDFARGPRSDYALILLHKLVLLVSRKRRVFTLSAATSLISNSLNGFTLLIPFFVQILSIRGLR